MAENAISPSITKVRLRFRKEGDLRFVSHHDLMRLVERFLRRAGLPFRQSQGFHPKPKMVFPSALSLGIIGHEEVLEIEFDGTLDAETVRQQLQCLCPEGLAFFAARAIPHRQTGMPVLAVYEVELPPDARSDLPEQIRELLARPELPIERAKLRDFKTADEPAGEERLDAPHTASPGKKSPPPSVRRIDLKPYLRQLRPTPVGLLMEFNISPAGTARPEEVLRLLGLESFLYAGAAVLHRTRLMLADETETLSLADARPVRTDATPCPREVAAL